MVGTVNSFVESVCGLHNELDRGEDTRNKTGAKLKWNKTACL